MADRARDAWTVGGGALAVVALLIGCACGIAIDRSATVATYPPATTFGDVLRLREAEKVRCFFLAPKRLGGGLRRVPDATCRDWLSYGFIVEDAPH